MIALNTSRGTAHRFIIAAFAVSIAATFLNLVWDSAGKTSPFYYNIAMGIFITTYCFLHGRRYFGTARITTLFVTSVLVSFCLEYAGVKTGAIYGEYRYGTVFGPKILDTVPWLIPLAWFFFIYPCVIITNEIIDGSKSLKDLLSGGATPVKVIVFALADSIALTAMDILIDPIWVSRGTWTWTGLESLPPERIFYGIPVQNYFGWLLTAFIIFLIFRTVFFARRGAPAEKDRTYFLPVFNFGSGFLVGTIEAWLILFNTAIVFVSVMTLGLLFLMGLYRLISFYGNVNGDVPASGNDHPG